MRENSIKDDDLQEFGRNRRDRARFYSHQESDTRHFEEEPQTSSFRPKSPEIQRKKSDSEENDSRNSNNHDGIWQNQSDQSDG